MLRSRILSWIKNPSERLFEATARAAERRRRAARRGAARPGADPRPARGLVPGNRRGAARRQAQKRRRHRAVAGRRGRRSRRRLCRLLAADRGGRRSRRFPRSRWRRSRSIRNTSSRGSRRSSIREAHACLAALGETLSVVLGEPGYYGRFGYTNRRAARFECEYQSPYPDGALLRLRTLGGTPCLPRRLQRSLRRCRAPS